MPDASTRLLEAGTLSAAFIVEGSNARCFIKTHLDALGRQSILKECIILSELYKDILSIRSLETRVGAITQAWLVMNVLETTNHSYAPSDLYQFSVRLVENLDNPKIKYIVPASDSFEALLNEAWLSLNNLWVKKLINHNVYSEIYVHLSHVNRKAKYHEPIICHGDFGPNNLMSDGVQIFAIDWEDAFWGVDGYDFIFWLSFFCNRKYYSREVLGNTPLGFALEQSILTMILVLKSELSLRNGYYCSNRMSINQRISEVLAL